MKRNFFPLVASQSVREEGRLSILRIINLLEDIKPCNNRGQLINSLPHARKSIRENMAQTLRWKLDEDVAGLARGKKSLIWLVGSARLGHYCWNVR